MEKGRSFGGKIVSILDGKYGKIGIDRSGIMVRSSNII